MARQFILNPQRIEPPATGYSGTGMSRWTRTNAARSINWTPRERKHGQPRSLKLVRKPQAKRPTAWARGVAWLESNVRISDLPFTITTQRIADRIPIDGLSAKQRRVMAGKFLASIGATRLGTPHILQGGIEVGLWCPRLSDLPRVQAMTRRQRILAAGERPADVPFPPQCSPVFGPDGDVIRWRQMTAKELAAPNDPPDDSTSPQPSPAVAPNGSRRANTAADQNGRTSDVLMVNGCF